MKKIKIKAILTIDVNGKYNISGWAKSHHIDDCNHLDDIAENSKEGLEYLYNFLFSEEKLNFQKDGIDQKQFLIEKEIEFDSSNFENLKN